MGNTITRNTAWRTKDGRRWKVRIMRNDHLLNATRALQGRSPRGTLMADATRAQWLRVMQSEARKRGLQLK